MICPTCETELPDDSAFCPVCGKKIEPPKSEPVFKPADAAAHKAAAETYKAPAAKSAAKSSGKNTAWVLAAALVVAVIVLGGKLSAANVQISQLSSQVQTAQSRAQTAESRANSLEKAGDMYDDMKGFVRGVSPDAIRQYKDLYSYSNAVIIKKGTTETVDIVWANNGTVSWWCDDTSVASPDWGEGWKSRTASLYITGNKVGTAEITISNSYNDHELKILAIVTE